MLYSTVMHLHSYTCHQCHVVSQVSTVGIGFRRCRAPDEGSYEIGIYHSELGFPFPSMAPSTVSSVPSPSPQVICGVPMPHTTRWRVAISHSHVIIAIRTFFLFDIPIRCVSHQSRFPSCGLWLSLLAPYPRTLVPPSEGARS